MNLILNPCLDLGMLPLYNNSDLLEFGVRSSSNPRIIPPQQEFPKISEGSM